MKLLKLLVVLVGSVTTARCLEFRHEMSAIEVCDSVHILLDSIPDAVRVTALVDWNIGFATKFMRCFGSKGRQAYQLVVAPIDEKYFPGNSLDQHHELIVVDLGCDHSSIRRLLDRKTIQLEMRYKWIFVNTKPSSHQSSHINQPLNMLLDKPILPRSDVFYIAKRAHDEYIYGKIYKILINTTIINEPYGIYSDGRLTRFNSHQSGLEKRRNLQGKVFNGVVILGDQTLLETFRNYGTTTTDIYTKVVLLFYLEVMQYANSSYVIAKEKTFGTLNATTGKWSYMFGRLQDVSSDFNIMPVFVLDQRIPIMQYTVNTHTLEVGFFFRRPGLASTDNVFLMPFDSRVWLCTGLLIVLLTAILVGIVVWENRSCAKANTVRQSIKPHQPRPATVGDAFMLVCGASCNQGSPVVPQSFTSRLVVICVNISTMFLFISYSAYIIVLLQSLSNHIKSLQNLYDSKFPMALHNNSFNYQVFVIQTEPLQKAIFDNKIRNPDGTMNIYNTADGVRLVREGKAAVNFEHTVAYREMALTFQEHEKCELKHINYVAKPVPYLATTKNSSYYEVLMVGSMRVLEHGLHSRHCRRVYTSKPDCTEDLAAFEQVSIVETKPAFLFLAWGAWAALAILLVEKLCKRIGTVGNLVAIIKTVGTRGIGSKS